MKLLVATKEGQGKRANDFSHAGEGEIVRFGMECDGEEVDGGCGCRRSMCGMLSARATTTMKVDDLRIDIEKLTDLMAISLKLGGWDALVGRAREEAEELVRLADKFPVGAIIEKRGDQIQTR